MKPFLREVAEEIVSKFKSFKDVVLVLPSKRSGIFLKHELLKINTVTTYAPEIYSIEEFVEKLSGLAPAEPVQLLFEFYEVYKKETPPENADSFQQFSRWARIVLQDFSEIDSYLVDHNRIFAYLSSVKEINHWYLEEEKTELQKNYIRFWNNLKDYYIHLKKRLPEKQIAYPGLLYREAFNNAKKYLAGNPEKHHIFIGFSALNKAEEQLFQEFLNVPQNHIVWDIDKTFLSDSEHAAGLFIKSYKKEWPYFKHNAFKIISDHFKTKKDICITGIPKTVGQAKYAGKLIEDIHKKTGNTQNTAIVMGNADLLIPLLNALSPALGAVNVTYGAPLYQTPVSSFFGALFQLTENRRKNTWYYKNVLHILSHPLTKKLLWHKGKDHTEPLIESIRRENIVFVSPEHIKKQLPQSLLEVSGHIFTNAKQLTVNEAIKKCMALIALLKAQYHKNHIYLEYLYKFYQIFNRILYLNTAYGSVSDIPSLKRIYYELLREETVNFKGEPLKGLQIMGMLESRNLDFENLIITGLNEGILPSGKKHVSFLPFQVRIAFNLPTYSEKDAIYTYHFYRLLQRAKNIHLLYNTEPEALEGGEKSRFLLQLITQKQPGHNVAEIIASPEVSHASKKKIGIKKNTDILDRLKKVARKGFSPTSLSNYIRNPMDFYHDTVLSIKPEDEMEETITARTLGIIIHSALEELYRPLEGRQLHEADVLKMKKIMKIVISQSFAGVYSKDRWNSGKNLISSAIVERYIRHFLDLELQRLQQGKTIKILHVEKSLQTSLNIPGSDLEINLKGTIDRVEEVDGIISITDYKTGKVIPSEVEIADEQDMIRDYKYHKAFQLLSYTWLYTKNYPSEKPVEAAVLSFKNLKSGYLKFGKKEEHGGRRRKTTHITPEILSGYEKNLGDLILDIFDARIPFTEQESDY